MVAFNIPFSSFRLTTWFRRQLVIAADPNVVKVILNGRAADFPKANRYQRLRFAFGDGLLTAPIPIWKASREVRRSDKKGAAVHCMSLLLADHSALHTARFSQGLAHPPILNKHENARFCQMLSPGFHADALKGFVEIFNTRTAAMLRDWHRQCGGGGGGYGAGTARLHLNAEMNSLTLGVFCEAGFGLVLSHDPHDPAVGVIREDVRHILDETNKRIGEPTEWWPHVMRRADQAVVGPALGRMRALALGIVQQRLDRSAEKPTGAGVDTGEKPEPRTTDLLDMMIAQSAKAEGGVSSRLLLDQLFTMMGAGHETTASALLWTLLELGRRPDELKRCTDAVDVVLGPRKPGADSDSAAADRVSYEQISALNRGYLGLVLKESLRLHPPIPLMGRQVGDQSPASAANAPKGLFRAHPISGVWCRPHAAAPPPPLTPCACAPWSGGLRLRGWAVAHTRGDGRDGAYPGASLPARVLGPRLR